MMKAWTPIPGSVWGVRRHPLLEEVCHWEWTFKFQNSTLFPTKSPSAKWLLQHVSSQLLLSAMPACCHAPCHGGQGFAL